ncbi:chromate resistance protein ChrB domain-containing protein [Hydrogenophaga sp. PML113]|uniref:chromate resistance protein ChrB domain-containing protein n=1 Tax=Hydrogenophaga sp. PML113 TaxID=1899350 RepID=UPI0020C773CE|nr:chromate resistance protein ChrB domain-containing protein [Hydrogenophaga sp. PML113]
MAQEAREHGGSALLMELAPIDEMQRAEVLALFARDEAYAQWRSGANEWLDALPSTSETDARRRLRTLEAALRDIESIDYYPGEAVLQANAALADLRTALDARFSKDEPRAQPEHGIAKLNPRQFQAKRWATRARPWVDRLASAWLILRYIDPQASFVWLKDVAKLPRGALGFDFDGARFTHVGGRVTFEVLLTSFGLDQTPRLVHLGTLVHFLDAGGIPVAEASGLEAVLSGLRELHADDDALLAAACSVFDALVATPAGKGKT